MRNRTVISATLINTPIFYAKYVFNILKEKGKNTKIGKGQRY